MFRGAVRGDLPQILKIYAHARAVMKASGNPTQWGDDFPPQELLEEDIDSNRLFLYVVNGQIEAVFAFILGADPTYAVIEDGQWLDDTLPYGTVHRLASAGKQKGVSKSRVPIKQYLQKFPQWGRFGVTSVTPFLLLPVHPEGCTPAHRT